MKGEILVHGGIRHLETPHTLILQLQWVHGGIRHLEIHAAQLSCQV